MKTNRFSRLCGALLVAVTGFFTSAVNATEVVTQWVHGYGYSDYDYFYSLAVDSNDNSFTVGTVNIPNVGPRCVVIKKAPDGTELWKKENFGCEWPTDITVDSANNSYLIGTTGANVVVYKISPAGATTWSTSFAGGGRAIALDSQNNILAFSLRRDPGANPHFQLHKLSNSGSVIWTRLHAGTKNYAWAMPSMIAMDSNNGVIVGGYEMSGTATNNLYVKYDTNGNVVWTNAAIPNRNKQMAVDNLGNLYSLNYSVIRNGGQAVDLYKIGTNGVVAWGKQVSQSSTTKFERFEGFTTHNDKVVIVGYETIYGGPTQANAVVEKYDTNGNRLWRSLSEIPDRETLDRVVVDSKGNYLASGRKIIVNGTIVSAHVFGAAYDSNGTLLGHNYGGAFNASEIVDIAATSTGDFISGTYGAPSGVRYDIYTAKFKVVSNNPPTAVITAATGPLECSNGAASINVSSAGSSDPDNDPLTFTWSVDSSNPVAGASATLSLNLGYGHIITLTADDQKGGTSIASIVRDVVDTIAPSVSVNSSLPLPLAPIEAQSAQGTLVSLSPNVSDGCGIQSITTSHANDTVYPLGSTDYVVTATDLGNNSASAKVTVTIVDTTPPTITIENPVVSVEASANPMPANLVDLGNVGADDLFGTTLTNNAPASYAVDVNGVGSDVVWTAVDGNGLSSSATQTVHITDTTPPVLNIPADVTLEANFPNSIYTDLELGIDGSLPNASDIVDGDLTSAIVITRQDSYALGNANTIGYGVTDAHGNNTSKSQTVTVVDTTPPALFAVPADRTVEAEGQLTVIDLTTDYQAFDARDIFGITITQNAPVEFPLGATVVTWHIEDDNGNFVEHQQTITVVDTTPPALNIPANVTLEANNTISAYGDLELGIANGLPNAYDIVDGDVTAAIVVTRPAGYNLGANTISYTVKDAAGNVTTLEQTVTVVDTTKPVFTFVQSSFSTEATAALSQLTLQQATADDFFLVSVTSDAPANGYPVGNTVVTWTATDSSGNFTTASLTVTVVDTTPPVLNIPADVTLEANAVNSLYANSDLGIVTGMPNATDLVDGNLNSKIVIGLPANGFALGANIVSYQVTDQAGNSSSRNQTVTVVDTTAPVFTNTPADILVIASGKETTLDIGTAIAEDIFLLSVTNDAPAVFTIGQTIVTWTAVDTSGNSTTYQQTITAAYQFNGFERPLVEGGVYKLGRVLPVRFSLSYANGAAVTDAVATIYMQKTIDGAVAGDLIEVVTLDGADTGNHFMHEGNGVYRYNLSTSAFSVGAYRLMVDLHDDTDMKAINIAFR